MKVEWNNQLASQSTKILAKKQCISKNKKDHWAILFIF